MRCLCASSTGRGMDLQLSKCLIFVAVGTGLLVTTAGGAPTCTVGPSLERGCEAECRAFHCGVEVPGAGKSGGAEPSLLYCVGAKLLEPSALEPGVQASQGDAVVGSLPVPPAAVFLGILGAGLVLFVDNRGRMAACCAALAMLGQSGIRLLPKLVQGEAGWAGSPTHACALERAGRYTVDPLVRFGEGLRYVGLLHRLAESGGPGEHHGWAMRGGSRRHLASAASAPWLSCFCVFSDDGNARPFSGRAAFVASHPCWDLPFHRTHSRAPPGSTFFEQAA